MSVLPLPPGSWDSLSAIACRLKRPHYRNRSAHSIDRILSSGTVHGASADKAVKRRLAGDFVLAMLQKACLMGAEARAVVFVPSEGRFPLPLSGSPRRPGRCIIRAPRRQASNRQRSFAFWGAGLKMPPDLANHPAKLGQVFARYSNSIAFSRTVPSEREQAGRSRRVSGRPLIILKAG